MTLNQSSIYIYGIKSVKATLSLQWIIQESSDWAEIEWLRWVVFYSHISDPIGQSVWFQPQSSQITMKTHKGCSHNPVNPSELTGCISDHASCIYFSAVMSTDSNFPAESSQKSATFQLDYSQNPTSTWFQSNPSILNPDEVSGGSDNHKYVICLFFLG